MKKVLMIASMASMLDNFNTNNIELLHELGYEVTLAANFEKEDSNSRERVQSFKQKMQESYKINQVDFTRRLTNVKGNIKSYKQIKQLAEEDYTLVHCHSPICAAMTRLAFRRKRKAGTKVIYTAHGFHFYKGAPLKNWLLFFPVEWICSHWTDVLITINREDYAFAKRYMKAKKVEYVPGVGIDIEKFQDLKIDRKTKREELGIKQDDILLLSVGELSDRKNQAVVIRALKKAGIRQIKYFICGMGNLETRLRGLIKDLNLENQVILLGYRDDIAELCCLADVFVFPSIQEGLPVALMEAMASGLPTICSNIRGNTDLIVEGKGGFLCCAKSDNDFAKSLKKIYENRKIIMSMGKFNKARIEKFSLSNIAEKMKIIYENI